MKFKKVHYVVGAAGAVFTLAVAINRFYEHPTFGRGLTAFTQAVLAADALG